MTGEEFYNEFKAALNYVGVGFHGMDRAVVCLDQGKLVVIANGKSCSLEIPVIKDNKND